MSIPAVPLEKSDALLALRSHLLIDTKFTDSLLELNLLSFFVQKEDTAIGWVNFIESRYRIDIPDCEVDYFFFSDLNHMIRVINKYAYETL
ncbi:hypothetical protein [Ohtaekwangia koreensis]|uniref:Uncharacterized protein n=1 Tax=Ohtaekwangia koreensis TaxID=688867 RepID=A0A1T5M5B0_9BACT|nr:hypothetical protein [Ohtaekwangia koreensis]SKC83315.1 hypothetical protein SAMN05660236_4418 [Ohtaekwangia koreensis]